MRGGESHRLLVPVILHRDRRGAGEAAPHVSIFILDLRLRPFFLEVPEEEGCLSQILCISGVTVQGFWEIKHPYC